MDLSFETHTPTPGRSSSHTFHHATVINTCVSATLTSSVITLLCRSDPVVATEVSEVGNIKAVGGGCWLSVDGG